MEKIMYLIPEPHKIQKSEGSFEISYSGRIVIDESIKENGMTYAGILQQSIKEGAGICLSIIRGSAKAKDICLKLSADKKSQEYGLKIRETEIIIEGGDGAGLLYGVSTLCQMTAQCGAVLECLSIEDMPDVLTRGYFLDESRGRVLKLSYLKKVVDRLCRYKINQFQLYMEHTYLFCGLSEMWRDETPLTAEDILELDAYCRKRHIELVPSLASFGHLYMLLRTKSYRSLCELQVTDEDGFSFWDRMRHHTINVTDDRSLQLIKGMIREYMALFTSDKFNLCADETFDLGKGKSAFKAEETSVHRLYIEYVKELCTFLLENGKQPMFWGDIICGEPELIKELPEQTICLTWGYAADQNEDASRDMAKAGAVQYLCPGVGGWNQWINLIEDSYKNIVRMCGYAKKYGAIGILNTDWGDCGHVNHPEYGICGMIYGAAFSWNDKVIDFEEINRQISILEYKDASGEFAGLLAKIPEQSLFCWWDSVVYYETHALDRVIKDDHDIFGLVSTKSTPEANGILRNLKRAVKQAAVHMDTKEKTQIEALDITIDGIMIWNSIGDVLNRKEKYQEWDREHAVKLAEKLETWFMSYKNLWRSISREGDLHHISEIMFWYADVLRGE